MVGFDLPQDGIAPFGVKAGGRFVQHQDARVHGHDAGNGDAAFLPARKLKRAFLQQFLPQADKGRGFAHAALNLRFVQAHVARAVGDIFGAGFLKQLVLGVLHDEPDEEARGAQVCALGPQVLPVDEHAARRGAVEPVKMADERRFAAAGGADDAHKIAFFHRKGNVVQRGGGVRHAGVVDIAEMFSTDNL